MKRVRHFRLATLTYLLSACQSPLSSPPVATPSTSPAPLISASPAPVPSARPTPMVSSTPTARPAQMHRLKITTELPTSLLLNTPPIPLVAEVLLDDQRVESAEWEVLTPAQAEIRSGHLILKNPGRLELRAYAPSPLNLEQRLSTEILPLPLPTPTPVPSLPPLERLSGALGETVSAGAYLFVGDKNLDGVHVLNTRSGKKTAFLRTGNDPTLMAVSPDQAWVYAGSENRDRVDVIEVASLTVKASLPVGAPVFDLVAGRDRLYVSYMDTKRPPAIFEPATSTPKGILPTAVPGKTRLAVSPDQKFLYAATTGTAETVLHKIDLHDEENTKVVKDTVRELSEEEQYLVTYRGLKIDPVLGIDLRDLLLSPDGSQLYLALSAKTYPSQLLRVDSETLSVQQRVNIGAFPDGLDLSPDGKYLYVSHQHFDLHVYERQSLKQLLRKPAPLWVSGVTATADGESVVVQLTRNAPDSDRDVVRLLDVSEIPLNAP